MGTHLMKLRRDWKIGERCFVVYDGPGDVTERVLGKGTILDLDSSAVLVNIGGQNRVLKYHNIFPINDRSFRSVRLGTEILKIAKELVSDYHRIHQGLLCTSGVNAFCQKNGCYWMLDVIWSYQPKCRRDPMLREMQFWDFKKKPDKSMLVTCSRDKGNVAIRQTVPYTDFPGESARLWVGPADEKTMVVMLPSEY